MPAYVIALICIASFIGFILLVYLAGGIYIFQKIFKRKKQQSILGSLDGASEQKKNIVVPKRKEAIEKLEKKITKRKLITIRIEINLWKINIK